MSITAPLKKEFSEPTSIYYTIEGPVVSISERAIAEKYGLCKERASVFCQIFLALLYHFFSTDYH